MTGIVIGAIAAAILAGIKAAANTDKPEAIKVKTKKK